MLTICTTPDQPSVPRLKWHHPTVGRSHGHAQGGVTAVGADFQDAATSISKPPWVDSINSGHLQKLEICTQRCIQDTWKTNGPDVIQTSRIYLVARFHLYGNPEMAGRLWDSLPQLSAGLWSCVAPPPGGLVKAYQVALFLGWFKIKRKTMAIVASTVSPSQHAILLN